MDRATVWMWANPPWLHDVYSRGLVPRHRRGLIEVPVPSTRDASVWPEPIEPSGGALIPSARQGTIPQ